MNIEDYISNKDFADYTVFSRSSNVLYFKYARSILKDDLINSISVCACKKHFEELVGKNFQLQKEYVENYHSDNEFFLTQRKDRNELYDIYFIARYAEIIIFFIRKSP